MPPARLEARMDSLLSFPVGLLHPLRTCRFIPTLSGYAVTHAQSKRRIPATCAATHTLDGEPPLEVTCAFNQALRSITTPISPEEAAVAEAIRHFNFDAYLIKRVKI